MKFLCNDAVGSHRMLGILGAHGRWFAGFSRRVVNLAETLSKRSKMECVRNHNEFGWHLTGIIGSADHWFFGISKCQVAIPVEDSIAPTPA